ncbi:hypothetical protein [Nonomuraea ceibae]|uniref:hypothetical protein n=1 Tax=Nonomuraea ceibae TaxID=1935170 RepID=UPI001C5EB031|nr:hypothetical protein [Nonomuraea ceibae]
MAEAYLTVEIRHDPVYQASRPYQAWMAWCAAEGVDHDGSWLVEVYDETPVRVVRHVIELHPVTGEWLTDPETGEPLTHVETRTASTLPPLQGYVVR